MREKFYDHLMNGLSDYDAEYLPTYDYAMLLSWGDKIKAYFANVDWIYFVEYPIIKNDYETPLEVLESEVTLCSSDAGIMYENINGEFKEIAFIERKK